MEPMPDVNDMMIVPVDPRNPLEAELSMTAELLRSGGLVVAPTETRYGLLIRADRPESLQRLFTVKGRSVLQPTSVFVADIAGAARLARINESATRLAKAFLPGPLTLVLPSIVAWEPPLVVAGKIGIRISSSPVIAGLVGRVEAPLTATSANRSGSPDLATAAEIQAVFGDEVDLYLDGGELMNDTSTVVDCTGPEVIILRRGAVDESEIRLVLGPG
jgi:L-threonylcarbamoyladenylate synthase